MAIRLNLDTLAFMKGKRENRKIDQKTLAYEIGVSIGTINRYMNGSVQQVDLDVLDKICLYFKCQPGAVLEHISSEEVSKELAALPLPA